MHASTYYITPVQLSKLLISHPFRKFRLEPLPITERDWNTIFKSELTLAWNANYLPKQGMELIYKDEAGSYMIAEVVGC